MGYNGRRSPPICFPPQPEDPSLFPIRDAVRSRRFPVVNYALIAANVLSFLFVTSLGPSGYERFLGEFGVVPARLSFEQPLAGLTLFSSMFLHGGWFHLLSNMWTLFIFGDNVQDQMGSGRYLGFYLIAGTVAGLAHAVSSPNSTIPTVGASGAIAGVLGAYFILFPRARVTTFIPLFFLPWFVDVPAIVFIGIWFFTQLSQGLLSLGAIGDFGGIAWWAHVGGFVVGLLLVRAFVARPKTPQLWVPDDHWSG